MTIFQTRAYRDMYRNHFGGGKSFMEIATPNNAQIWLQARGIEARRLEMWGEGIADCGGAEVGEENASELWCTMRGIARDYDGCVLNQIEASSPLVELARRGGWAISDAEVCPTLAFPPTFDGYVKSLGKNMREQIKRYPKRLAKNFAVEVEMAQTQPQVDEFLTQLFELHGKRWRARGQTGVLVLPSRQKFHRALCADFLKRDWLRLWRLKLDGRPACVLLSYFWGGRYWFFIGGFEPEMMRWSVGTCLFARVFQHAIEEGATEFDFLRGAEEYKYRFGAVDREFVNLQWFAPTPRGKILEKRVALECEFWRRVHEKFGAN
ncbi:GNAT family N-acetyltransferase [bacterium]|nr:MAG: GNAT family N-acetyltransferase [bacterium]